MRFILHVWTLNPKATPWVVEWEGWKVQTQSVQIDVPVWTRREGHEPCANWYIEGEAESVIVDGDTIIIS